MFRRLANSWELVKASWDVLRADKELILFPLASGLATFLVTIVFAIPMLLAGAFDNISNGDPGMMSFVIGFVFSLTMYFIVIFANTALVGAALIRLQGGDPTVQDGLKIAMSKVDKIFGYAIISAVVNLVLQVLRDRGGIAGQVASWLGNIAWNLATYLVVPVLVAEDIGPIEAIQRSASLLKRTWGEQIAGNFSIGAIFGLLTFAVFLLIGGPLLVLAFLSGSVLAIVLTVIVVVTIVMGIQLIGSALSGIYVAAVYRYATFGIIDERYFRPDLIEGAFRRK